MHHAIAVRDDLELLGDRFAISRRRRAHGATAAIDLATGQRVEIHEGTIGGGSEHARWASRCDRLHALQHRYMARLLDWGIAGENRRFEAWHTSGPAHVAPGDTALALRAGPVARFLRAVGWTRGVLEAPALTMDGVRVIVPGPDTGHEGGEAPGGDESLARDELGLKHIARESVALAVERAHEAHGLTTFALCGPPGAGLTTAVHDLARGLRLEGIVPVGAHVLDRVRHLLVDRSAAVIANGAPAQAWRSVQAIDLMSTRVCAVIFAARAELHGVPLLGLQRVPIERLVDAVLPQPDSDVLRDRIVAAARRSMGWPGRFAALVWRERFMRKPAVEPQVSRAAEGAAVYDFQEVVAPVSEMPVLPTWPAAGDLSAHRLRLARAIDWIDRGRHVAGERALREALGFLLRRHDHPPAIAGSLALAASLRRRGRTKDAKAALDEIRPVAVAAADDESLTRISGLVGMVAIDERRLPEADAVLAAARQAADALASPELRVTIALAHARCLFWMGQYDEAEGVLRELDERGTIPTARGALAVAVGRARAAVGRGRLDEAMRAVEKARHIAATLDDAGAIALATSAAAFVHVSAGDYAAARTDAARCVEAARRAHDPLLGLRGRLLGAEAARRQGVSGLAGALTRRLRQAPGQHVPPIVRVRVDLLAALLSDRNDSAARDLAQRTGLPALVLFAPPAERSIASRSAEAVVDIVQACQSAGDDRAVLDLLCERLKVALRASAVACYVDEHGSFTQVASAGGRLEPALAARVAALDRPLVPHGGMARLDGGVSVRYAGRTVGTVIVHWPSAPGWTCAEAGLLLETAAAAAGPALTALAALRARPVVAPWELLGSSVALADLKDAVERASTAPFATLIEGESGSGKELVARAIHRRGARRDRPFCTLNCAALPEELVESELFGHARGAFTGAAADRPGVFEEAHTGTLFLDEIGELSPRAQAKLLRTLQEGEVRRVGENGPRRVDVRVLAATNRDLRAEVARGRFRLDLLYRLDVIRVVVPPLRARRDDIPVLAEHFWHEATLRIGSRATLGAAAVGALARYDWPGNVRELQNVLAALAVRAPRRGVVAPSALPACFAPARDPQSWRLEEARRTFDTQFVRAALARSGGHRGRAAEELGMTRQGLTKLMARLDMHDGLDEAPRTP